MSQKLRRSKQTNFVAQPFCLRIRREPADADVRGNQVQSFETDDLGADMLVGVEAIAKALRTSTRRAYYLCETRQIPAFKLGGRWHLRPSAYRAHIARLEAGEKSAA